MKYGGTLQILFNVVAMVDSDQRRRLYFSLSCSHSRSCPIWMFLCVHGDLDPAVDACAGGIGSP